MSRGRVVIHGHFYQPSRVDPFSGQVPVEPSAAPYHDWNERIDAECYRPNAERGNLDRISFDAGPTLAAWLENADPDTYRQFVAADRPVPAPGVVPLRPGRSAAAPQVAADRMAPNGHGADLPPLPDLGEHGNAMAQSYHHTILPLASLADRRTEITWGLRDFELRYGRRAHGLWLPETAVDLPTLRLLAEAGISHTILAPWQSVEQDLETRRPYRVALGGGRSIVVFFYDGALSASVSFDANATADADAFTRQHLVPRLSVPMHGVRVPGGPAIAGQVDGESPFVVIATDGELYGHHQQFRDLFLQRLVNPPPNAPDRGFDLVRLSEEAIEPPGQAFQSTRLIERTSWSCHHGVARWGAECPDAPDGRWKGPLRAALDRLAAGIDVTTEALLRPHADLDVWAARDAYIDVIFGTELPAAFSARWLGSGASAAARDRFLALLEAQRWRLAMFASDGWFWDDPIRMETRQILRAAARASRMVDDLAGTDLEGRFVEDLTLFTSPSHQVDGLAIYREALAEVGQPLP